MSATSQARVPVVTLAAAALACWAVAAAAQGPKAQPPNTEPAQKPYKAVAITIPAAPKDAALDAMRKDLAGIAQRKDKTALAAKIIAKDFFWERDFSGSFDANKPGIENLTMAVNLDNDDNSGWDALAGFATEATMGPLPGRSNVICSPAPPEFDDTAFEKLVEESQTDGLDWMYPRAAGLAVRSAAQPRASIVETVGLGLIRTLGFEGPEGSGDPIRTAWVRVAGPSGKPGFVAPGSLLSPYSDRLCFVKDAAGAWKIGGYVGGGD